MSRRHTITVLAALVACHGAPALAADARIVADEVRLFEWIRTFWPIVVVFGGMVVAAVLVGLGTRFASSAALDKLRIRVDAIELACSNRETRLTAVEKSLDSSPTRGELQEDIAELGVKMAGVEAGLTGLKGQLETANTYLHSLIEHGLVRRP